MPALYRKYRPQSFSEVVGQKHIVQTLKNASESGKPAHAYLFCGGRGVGKTSLARILAKAVNCLEPKKGDCCNKCKMCLAASEGTFLDLIEIDAASNTGVENIRELIEHARFRPSLGKYKIFIIDEVHMLSRGAFNALLKTLEEPPEHVIFILATTEAHKVPATIVSRTQRFDFSQLSSADIAEALEKILKQEKFKLSKEAINLVAERAEGSMRDSLSILDKVFSLGQDPAVEEVRLLLGASDIGECIQLMQMILDQDAKAIIERLQELAYSGTDFEVFNRDFLEYLRKILVFKMTSESKGFGLAQENLQRLTAQAERVSSGEVMRIIRLFLRAYQEIGQTPSPELPMLLASLEVFVKNGYAPAASRSAPEEKPKKIADKPESPAEPTLPVASSEPVDLTKIADHWPEVLAEVKKVNNPLATIIKNAQPVNAEGDKIFLAVRFQFDKESIENIKNSTIITQAISKVTGTKVRIGGKIVKKAEFEPEKAGSSLADALSVFGGELIE